MSKVVNDPAQAKEILQDGSRNDRGSVVARELKVIAPSSEPSAPSRPWFDIQASRGLDSNGGDQTNFTKTVNGAELKKLSPVTGCNQFQTRIKRSLDRDGQPDSSRSESPGFENYSNLQFPDCGITDDDKGHGKVGAWGAKIGSVLAVPMRRIGSRNKSVDSGKSVQSGLDALERERSSSKAQPGLYSDEHDISMGGVRSPPPTHTSPQETQHDGQPSPRGETHHPTFRITRGDGLGSPVGNPHQSPPARSQSRMRQTLSKYSGKIATWRASSGADSNHQSQPFASGKFSPPDSPKKFKSPVNRFLRPEQGSDAEDMVPPNALTDEGPDISPGASHLATVGASTNSEQPGPTKPGFRRNLTKRVDSARKRMPLPFIFGSDVPAVYSPIETLGPSTVPPEPPRRIEATPSDLPGHFSLPSEAKSVTVSTVTPYLERTHATQEWTLQDLGDMNLIQSTPPSSFQRYENTPSQPPPPETNNLVKSPTAHHTLPIAPGVNVVVPFESQEYAPEAEASGGVPKASGVSGDITTRHGNPYPEDPRDKLKSGTNINELDASAALQGISAPPGGKPVELQEEVERRNRRDSRVMGLNPETMPGDDRPADQADEDGRRDTYGAAIREIAGLDLMLRGPPALHSSNLGNVSGRSSNVNNFSSFTLQLAPNDEPAVTFPATLPPDSPEPQTTAVTISQSYNSFPRSSVTSASLTLTTQFTIAPAPTIVPAISTSPQLQQHPSMSRRVSSSFILEELSRRVHVR